MNDFVKYLSKVRKVLIVDVKTGSLIFTLECGSLRILDDLWEEYITGHLNEVAQLYLVTNDILEEFDLSSFKLASLIKYKEYRACRQRLTIEGRFLVIITSWFAIALDEIADGFKRLLDEFKREKVDCWQSIVPQGKFTELCSSAAVVSQRKSTELCSSAAVVPQSKSTEM